MYCPSCGNEITVELKYCNRCGANLIQGLMPMPVSSPPVKLTAPTVVLGLTVVSGLGIIFAGAAQFAILGIHPAALTWIILFSMATLFGCTALMIRFWTKIISANREAPQLEIRRPPQPLAQPQLPPRLGPVPSVTEHTTRTFSHAYREKSEE
jgi:hypothetical protein